MGGERRDTTRRSSPRSRRGASPARVRRAARSVVSRTRWPQLKRLRSAESFQARLDELGIRLPFADPPTIDALASSHRVAGRVAPNRFAILPMEGWDGTDDGRPTDLVRRRWDRFGASGAGLVWGGEAFAVRPDGRANARQLCLGPSSADDLAELRGRLAP